MKRVLKIVLPVLILAVAVAVFAGLKATKQEQEKPLGKQRVWGVDVEKVQPRSLSPALVLYGRVESPAVFKAAAPAPSRVDRILVREGEEVTSDQLLAILDERDFLPRLEQARADVAELDAKIRSEEIRHQSDKRALAQERRLLELTRAGVSRARRMLKQKLGSDSAVDEAAQAVARQELAVNSRRQAIADHPARLKALEARLARAKSRLAESERDFERSRIKAPYNGVVADVAVAEGDQVRDNAVLLSLYDPAKLEVRARIPAPFQSEVQSSLNNGEKLLAAADGVELLLSRQAGEADASGVDGLFRIRKGQQWLRPGQIVRLRLLRRAQEGAFPVPFQAVYGNDRVYSLQEGVMRGHRVESLGSYLDSSGRERMLVRSATLQAGDELVITHLPNAVEGLRAEAVAAE